MSYTIGGQHVGRLDPLFVIAELGLNHGGDVSRALQLVDAAADAGASAVKVQSFRADRLVAANCPAPTHVEAPSLRAFFQTFELDESGQRAVADRARSRGLAFIATAFDLETVDVLESIGCDAIKIASGDLTFEPLIQRAATTARPLILSTGMSSLNDVRAAERCARAAGSVDIAFLHCVSAYPVPPGQENLRAIVEIERAVEGPVGLSDHSRESLSAPLAMALGARLYERHFCLGTAPEGRYDIERDVSSTRTELAAIVSAAARAQRALGDGTKVCLPVERENRAASRRGLHLSRDHRAGDVIDSDSVVALRPAVGIDPRERPALMGRRVARDCRAGDPLREGDLAPVVSAVTDATVRGVA